ncbi:HNH endonuclease [Pseudolabrys taiwanensis]|uniref:HNH endonuclease n=1 Tax=Pseudolabrys taiwanensis TaxID=331696 RepID=A0A345ZST6_9HYPH|nr:HNH endonuclease [Pseudolabrys taiwanensis]AXK79983.1 HNH endonuclease [Pseudolabrys taiwanensis]
MESRTCIYCCEIKPDNEFSEEHIIPQFMGGSSDCKEAVTRDVCQRCNSIFGRYVDAPVAKAFFQNSVEYNAWESCFDYAPDSGNVFPLIYFGLNRNLALEDGEVAEVWLAPDGGTAWHIHEDHGEDFDTFAGGDPVRRRREKTGRVYSFLASEHPYWFLSNMRSVQSHFHGEPIFLGTETDLEHQLPSKRIKGRFCRKDPEAQAERAAIRTVIDTQKPLNNRVPMDLLFDVRFLAKLAIGFGHSLFGPEYGDLQHTATLRRLLQTRRSNLDTASPTVRMKTYFTNLQDLSLKPFRVPAGFVFFLTAVKKDAVLAIIFPSGRTAQVSITDSAVDAAFNAADKLKEERVFVSFPQLKRTIGPISMFEYIAWRTASHRIPTLDHILRRLTSRSAMPALRQR